MSTTTDEQSVSLQPLTPEYSEEAHGLYKRLLLGAVENEKIRNIALSGPYGAGKSSILEGFAEEVSSVGYQSPDSDEGLPTGLRAIYRGQWLVNRWRKIKRRKKIITVSVLRLTPVGDEEDGAGEETAYLQREVVKKLLYQAKSRYLKGAHFRRTVPPAIGWPLVLTCLLVLLSGVYIYNAYREKIDPEGWLVNHFFSNFRIYAPLATVLLAILLFRAFRALLPLRWLNKLKVAGAELTLGEVSDSYFDRYLDDIVYAFARNKYEVVIFEDLDRFNDPAIFEHLRELNDLINSCPDVKQAVRFIYAIRESVFAQSSLGEGAFLSKGSFSGNGRQNAARQCDVIGAERAKFFDLIIPVVPFVTHETAAAYLREGLKRIGADGIPEELIRLIGSVLPDLRSLQAICNEMAIYRRQIPYFDDARKSSEDLALLSLLVYKSVDPFDFELIRLGQSKLDDFHDCARKAVSIGIEKTRASLAEIENQYSEAKRILSEKRFISALRSIRLGIMEPTSHHEWVGLFLDERELPAADEDSWGEEMKDLWRWFSESDSNERLFGRYCHLDPHSDEPPVEVVIGRHWIFKTMGVPCGTRGPIEYFRALSEQKRELEQRLKDFQDGKIPFLLEADDILLNHQDEDRTLSKIVEVLFGSTPAASLVKGGYISETFSAFTSLPRGRDLSLKASIFLARNVDRGADDFHYSLSAEEIEQIFSYVHSAQVLGGGLWNISIYRYLLEAYVKDESKYKELYMDLHGELVKSPAKYAKFISAFIASESGSNGDPKVLSDFLHSLACELEELLLILIQLEQITPEKKLAYVNFALENAHYCSQVGDPRVIRFLAENYAKIPVFMECDGRDLSWYERLMSKFKSRPNRLLFSDLNLLCPLAREIAVGEGLFEMNDENLDVLITQFNITLSRLLTGAPQFGVSEECLNVIFKRVTEKRTAFIRFLEHHAKDSDVTASAHELSVAFERLSVLCLDADGRIQRDENLLDPYLERVPEDIRVTDLPRLSAGLAGQLEDHETSLDIADFAKYLVSKGRVAPTLRNLVYLVCGHKTESESLRPILQELAPFERDEDVTDEEASALAIWLISEDVGVDPALLRAVINSMNLSDAPRTGDIQSIRPVFLSLALEARFVPDNLDTYRRLKGESWEVRLEWIRASADFGTYITPEALEEDLWAFLLSGHGIEEHQKSVLARFDEFLGIVDDSVWPKVLDTALNLDVSLPPAAIASVASDSQNLDMILGLLATGLSRSRDDNALRSELLAVIPALPQPFCKLVQPGKRPTLPYSSHLDGLLKELQALGIVGKSSVLLGGAKVRVSVKSAAE